MAHSSRRYVPGTGVPLEIPRPKLNLRVYNMMALRRIRFTRTFAVLVALSVLLSVTVSFVITATIAKNAEVLAARVDLSKLPFHGLVVADWDAEEVAAFQKSIMWSGVTYRVEWAEVESTVGHLRLLGAGHDLPHDTIRLLFPVDPIHLQSGLSAWVEDNPSSKLNWENVIVPDTAEGFPALYGWALVNPASLTKIDHRHLGVLLELAQHYDFDPANPAGSSYVARYFSDVEKRAPEGATVITPYSGRVALRKATRQAFSSWQFISLLVLLSAAAAITCVFTVSFLGRKRSLGIFRVLGGTVTDLRGAMTLEAAYISLPGIALGILAGHYLSQMLEMGNALPLSAYVTATVTGILTMAVGVWIPLRLVNNANCDQLLNNRPVYVFSNPSCANCGLCGGI